MSDDPQRGNGKLQFPSFNLPDRTEARYAAWLLVRYQAGDSGARPLAAGTVFWESPDVWVEGPAGINMPEPGVENQVYALVTNLGYKLVTRVVVKFWWADPSLAITEANAHLIGVGFADIPSGYTVKVPCPEPWIPVVVNGGHECLIAEAYSPLFDRLTAPMDPVEDRHVGQKNEQLLVLAPGQKFRVGLRAVNAASLGQLVAVEAYPSPLGLLPATLTARLAGREGERLRRLGLRAPARILPIDVRLSDQTLTFDPPSTLFARRLLTASIAAAKGAAAGGCDCAAPQVARTAAFAPWEARTVEVVGAAPPDARPGDTFAFRIQQRAGGLVIGGYTVVIVIE